MSSDGSTCATRDDEDIPWPLVENDALQKVKVSHSHDGELGPGLLRHLGHELGGNGHGQHLDAIHLVIAQIEILFRVEPPVRADDVSSVREDGVADHRKSGPSRRLTLLFRRILRRSRPGSSGEHDLGIADIPPVELFVEQPASLGHGDELDAPLLELPSKLPGHHARFLPRTPMHGDHPTRPGPVQFLRELTQNFVGGGVIALPAVSKDPRSRREEHESPELVGRDQLGKCESTLHLGVENPVEGLRGLLDRQLVLDDTRPVDDDVYPTELLAYGFQGPPDFVRLAYVRGTINATRAGVTNALERAPHFPLLEELLIASLDRRKSRGLAP